MGGGGGSGHFNNNIPTHGGGNGGGIIFITTKNFIGNGYKITANGQIGGSNVSDGASGGGAGGTIIVDVLNSYSGSVTIQANGGNGGTANDGGSSGRCYGAGGGGSGGVIYFTGSAPAVTINANGGNAGPEISSDPGCTLVLPSAGTNGSVVSNYSYTRSMSPAGYCASLLPTKLINFKATVYQKNVLLQWTIANPVLVKKFIIERFDYNVGWKQIHDLNANDDKNEYQFVDDNPMSGTNEYRLKIIEKNNQSYYSTVQKISIDVNNEFDIYPNPTTAQLNITGNFSSLATIILTDLSGKFIWQKKLFSSNNIIRIDLPVLAPGIYMLKINESIKKLVIR